MLFRSSAKGTQPAVRLPSLEKAMAQKKNGLLVHPDPEDPAVAEAAKRGACSVFWSYNRLPM